jgi:hypothetical protein
MEKRSNNMTPEERRTLAFHEAGHALVGWMLEYTDPLLKVGLHVGQQREVLRASHLFSIFTHDLQGVHVHSVHMKNILKNLKNLKTKTKKLTENYGEKTDFLLG